MFPKLVDEGFRYKILTHRDHFLRYFSDETVAGEILESLRRPWYRRLVKWPWISWEIEANYQNIGYYYWAPNELIGNEIRKKFLGEHPEMEIFQSDDCMIQSEHKYVTATVLKLDRDYPVPIKSFFNEIVDTQSAIVNSMSDLDFNDQMMVQVLMQPAKNYQRDFDKALRIIKRWDHEDEFEKVDLFQKGVYSKQTKLLGHCVIRLVVSSDDKNKAHSLLRELGRSFGQFRSEALNGFTVREPLLNFKPLLLSDWKKRRFPMYERRLRRVVLNLEELSGVLKVPSGKVNNSRLERLLAKNIEPPSNIVSFHNEIKASKDKKTYLPIGVNTYRMRKTDIFLNLKNLNRHLFVLGPSGSGKSVFLQNLIHDIAMFKFKGVKIGAFIIDPHGEMAKKAISGLPDDILKDVNYIRPNPREDIAFPFNVFDVDFPITSDSLSKNVADVLKRIWPENWGVRPDRNILNVGIALQYLKQASLPNIHRVLSDYAYAKTVADLIGKDPSMKNVHIMINELANLMDPDNSNASTKRQHRELTDSTTNKLEQFSLSSLLSKATGAFTNGIKWRQWMDEGKITILDLSKITNESEKKMYGSMALTMNLQAALTREELVERNEEMSIYPIIVDELPSFLEKNSEVVKEMADRTRYVNVPLIGAAQGLISQLPDDVADAIMRNFGSVISYRVKNPNDSFMMSKFFNHEEITEVEMRNLPDNFAYMSLSVGRSTSRAFSAVMNPPYQNVIDQNKVETLINRTLTDALEEEKAVQKKYQPIKVDFQVESNDYGQIDQSLQKQHSEGEDEASTDSNTSNEREVIESEPNSNVEEEHQEDEKKGVAANKQDGSVLMATKENDDTGSLWDQLKDNSKPKEKVNEKSNEDNDDVEVIFKIR